MDKRVLLVGANGYSVIMNALQDMLTKNGYVVDFVRMSVDEISKVKTVPGLVIVYSGDIKDNNPEAIIYLNDYCVEHELRIALVGYPNELISLKTSVKDTLIWHEFVRPFDAGELVKLLNIEFEKIQQNNGKKHILVVDDSEIQLRLIKSWLNDKYFVTTCQSAAQAISFLTKETVDLILLDYEMPVCSGPQFLEMIHSEVSTSSIPVIFLTAMADINSVKSVVSLKPAGYLLKSMPPADVVKNIDDFFEMRKNRKI